MNTYRSNINFISLVFFLGLIIGCSTEKDAALNVGYHNMTARYNGYFNANEIINQSVTTFRDKYKDDYTEVLDLVVYPSEKEASGLFPDMDKAIEKCSKVIYRHSMPNPNVVTRKEVENCRWIDDNWLVIGISHFYKREYDKAEEKFKYVMKEYNGQASQYAAKIWLAKIHIEQGDYSKAKLQLISVKNDIENRGQNKGKSPLSFLKKEKKAKKNKYQRKREKLNKKKSSKKNDEPEDFTKELLKEYQLASASLDIAEENYKSAIDHIEKAIEQTKKRKEAARYKFVLAQLYKELGQNDQAIEHFSAVVKSNAPYEMRFYAKINKALSNKGNSIELQKDLNKMLKDPKNIEYKDQIYYVLADVDLKKGNRQGAIENLTKSAIFSVNNKRQKAKSYLKLADMHFEDKLYIKSQKYYDSCVAVLPTDHEDFNLIDSKAKSLLTLVENYEVYTTQDSLQRIALMGEKEREKELKNILKDIKEKEKQKRINDKIRLEAQQALISKVNTANSDGNKWYFYNQKSLSRGYNDFRLLWGQQRVLEDNWRRSNKKEISAFSEFSVDSVSVPLDSLTVDILREGLPLTVEGLENSYSNQIDAMYNLGMIYKNQLSEESEAIDYFQKILKKDFEHEKVLSAAYQLYLIEKQKGSGKEREHKSFIRTRYPQSDIAALLENPDYFEEKERLAQKDLMTYKAALRKYETGRYVEAITASNEVIFKDTANKYLEKYYILKAKSISKTGVGGIKAAKDPLIKLIQLSPDSPEGKYAKQYLNNIGKSSSSNQKDSPYKYNDLESHYMIVEIPNDKLDEINDVKIKIANFNKSYFGSQNIKLSTTIVNDKGQALIIKTFDNFNKAEVYEKAYTSEPAVSLLNDVPTEFKHLIISKSNYATLMSLKDVEEYKVFYNDNY
ncbi:MAG: tetratricopeptide repeat protein [Crocinitomicaceae bacterium]